MPASTDLPASPPVDTQSYPPVERRRPWPWILGLVAIISVVLGSWAIFSPYLTHDRPELIEDKEIFEAIAEPCRDLNKVADDIRVAGSPIARAAALATISTAARAVPAALDRFDAADLADDLPAADWVRDWDTLLDAVDAYVVQLRSEAEATFKTPETVDGYSIVGRMDIAAEPTCKVPQALVALDPSPPPVLSY